MVDGLDIPALNSQLSFRNQPAGSAAAGDFPHELLEQGVVHFHKVGTFREPAFPDVGDVFLKSGQAFLLETAVLGGEIAVGLGVAGEALIVVAQDIVGKK
jgi:hypothetical protein